VEVNVVARGDREAVALVDRLSRRLGDGRPALTGLVDEILAFQNERFHGKGTRWRKLARHAPRARPPRPRRPAARADRRADAIPHRARGARPVPRDPHRPAAVRDPIYYARFHKRGQGVPKRVPAGLTRVQRGALVERLREVLLSP
jgi:hypothetical protein